ncbi:MAG: VanZ family protein [Eubacteriales bacterium]|nr:VanZ family protein [Eubacteriales bacterium]
MLFRLIDILNGAIVPLIAIPIIFGGIKRDGAKKMILVALFTLYLATVFDIVGMPYVQVLSMNPAINLIPFSDLFKEQFSPQAIFQFAANIVLFIPFGIFLPAIWKGFRSFRSTAIAGALLSLCIELCQLFSSRVVATDDLLMNTLGAMIGYGIIAAIMVKKHRKSEDAETATPFKHDGVELLIVVGLVLVCVIFIKYPIAGIIYSLPLFG